MCAWVGERKRNVGGRRSRDRNDTTRTIAHLSHRLRANEPIVHLPIEPKLSTHTHPKSSLACICLLLPIASRLHLTGRRTPWLSRGLLIREMVECVRSSEEVGSTTDSDVNSNRLRVAFHTHLSIQPTADIRDMYSNVVPIEK